MFKVSMKKNIKSRQLKKLIVLDSVDSERKSQCI